MICPYCKQEMRRGYIEQGRTRLVWYPYESRDEGLFLRKDKLKLAPPFVWCEVTVHRCESCKKLIIDENELEA